MKKGTGFYPEEIIFAATSACNLHCPHCFVSRNPQNLNIEKAVNFIESAKGTSVERIGFSGGEPFLYVDFLTALIKASVQNDFMFDRIMTNGMWFKDEKDLNEKLDAVFDAGFDGKLGISLDSFHESDIDKIILLMKAFYEKCGTFDGIELQSVVSPRPEDRIFDLECFDEIASAFDLETELYLDKKTGCGQIILSNEEKYITVWREKQTFSSENENGWKAKKWFKEDFCAGPGQILFVHHNGNIAPCCGFANENPALFIGNIDMSFDEVMKKAGENAFIKLIYEEGISSKIKEYKKSVPGTTDDNCTFCDFLAKKTNELN